MKQLVPFVIYPGTCRKAFEFYETALGGKISFMHTFAEAPISMGEDGDNRIFNAEFQVGDVRLRASDCMPNQDLAQGENIALFAVFNQPEDYHRAVEQLATDGKILMEQQEGFTMLCDQFGIQWMLVMDTDS